MRLYIVSYRFFITTYKTIVIAKNKQIALNLGYEKLQKHIRFETLKKKYIDIEFCCNADKEYVGEVF